MAVMRACLTPVIQIVYRPIALIQGRGADRKTGRRGGQTYSGAFLVADDRNERKGKYVSYLPPGMMERKQKTLMAYAPNDRGYHSY